MQNRQPKPIGTSTTSKLQIKLINGRTFGPVVILVSVDAAQLDSVCQYFVGMAAWNGSASLSTGNSTLRNTSKYKQQRARLMGSPWFLLPWLKINPSLTDFIWLILEITFHLWCLEHNPQVFNVSLASSSYLSTTPNCSSRNACRTAASAFQRHTSAVVPWLTWQHGTDQILTAVKDLWVNHLAQGKVDAHRAASGADHNNLQGFVPRFRVFPCCRALQCHSTRLPENLSTLLINHSSFWGSSWHQDCSEGVVPHLTLCTEWLLLGKKKTPSNGSACQSHFSTLNSTIVAALPAE